VKIIMAVLEQAKPKLIPPPSSQPSPQREGARTGTSEVLDSGLTLAIYVDPVESAKAAGLRYVSDDMPGIRRRKRGTGFGYTLPNGGAVQSPKELERIRRLAIPPAWTDVWICPAANGHLQATGRDARGRKQYRYHPDWRNVRDETKFGRMILFGEALPRMRERIEQDLSQRGLPRTKVLAAVVRLLETTLIRVGNREYMKQNNSFGLTTLRDGHVDIDGSKIRFEFRGKSGKDHSVEIQDRRLARVVKQCRDLPGQTLFQYVDENGDQQKVLSEDVNTYLREISGEDFTAKDFRTWGGTVLMLAALLDIGTCESEKEASRAVVQAVKDVAANLGNRPAICRKYYIHPLVIETFVQGELIDALASAVEESEDASDEPSNGLRKLEGQVLALLRGRAPSPSVTH
jgi:DNA topoisomerase-1